MGKSLVSFSSVNPLRRTMPQKVDGQHSSRERIFKIPSLIQGL
jgi:hypothetical protein